MTPEKQEALKSSFVKKLGRLGFYYKTELENFIVGQIREAEQTIIERVVEIVWKHECHGELCHCRLHIAQEIEEKGY